MGSVKLKDIAEKMNVSVVTISNALSGKEGVSESLRTEIRKTAAEMGYDTRKYKKKPEEQTRLGVIVSKKYVEVGASFYWSMYQQVAYEASKRNSFTMLEIVEKDSTGGNILPRMLHEKMIDGLIVIGRLERKRIQGILEVAKVPVVLLDFYEEGLECDAVMSCNYIGMYRATRYLLERGHREIAFLGSIKGTENILERYLGFCKAMEEYKIKVPKEWVIEDRDLTTGHVCVELPKQIPGAFVCCCDLSAGCLYDRLIEKKYRVPEDVSIIGYDNYLWGHSFAQNLTTYNVDMGRMAKTAIDVLLKKRKNPEQYQGVKYIDSVIIERGSVKSLN